MGILAIATLVLAVLVIGVSIYMLRAAEERRPKIKLLLIWLMVLMSVILLLVSQGY